MPGNAKDLEEGVHNQVLIVCQYLQSLVNFTKHSLNPIRSFLSYFGTHRFF